MGQFHDHGYRTFKSATALEKGRAVKITADNTVGYAGIGDTPIGVTASKVTAAAADVQVKLINSDGTFEGQLAAAATGLTAGANVGSMNANGEFGTSGNGATVLPFQLARAATAGQFGELILK